MLVQQGLIISVLRYLGKFSYFPRKDLIKIERETAEPMRPNDMDGLWLVGIGNVCFEKNAEIN